MEKPVKVHEEQRGSNTHLKSRVEQHATRLRKMMSTAKGETMTAQ